jgi:hypothetical protein
MEEDVNAEAAARDEPRRAEPMRRQWLSRAHVTIAAILGLTATTLALLFDLVPALKPDPRDRVGADVAVFALEPDVTIGDWIARGFSSEIQKKLRARYLDRAAVGGLLYVRTAVDGHKHDRVTLRYSVFVIATQKRLPADAIDAPPLDPLDVTSPSERSVQTLWVPDLSDDHRDLFIRVELWDNDGMLAVADSPIIRRGKLALQGDLGRER